MKKKKEKKFTIHKHPDSNDNKLLSSPNEFSHYYYIIETVEFKRAK